MPPVSEAQRRAMRAAAAGNSTIGIPQKVGQEFSSADSGGKLSAKKKPGKSVDYNRLVHKAREHSGY
jgi:hypothetical protein